ncbi:Thioredoxin 1, partial [Globisporangium splendens]
MGVTEIHGDADWNVNMQRAGGKLVVVDFSATWCGPCQFIKPVYHQLSSQYHDVVFLEVDEAQNRSLISALGVRGFPTFHFYVSQRKVDELVGADQNALRSKIEQWRQSAFNPFASAGMSLGGSAAAPADAREARLRRFNNLDLVPPPADSKPLADAKANMVCDPNTGECHPMDAAPGAATKEDEEEAKREQDAENSTELGIPPVNEEFLAQLLEMGFNELRARKSLLATDSQNLEAAISWIGEHQDDADIDEPIKFVDLSKHTQKPLTEEEKAAKIADLKARIEAKRVEREAREKRERIENEIKRRTMGQDMQNAKEEYDRIQRKLAAEKLKKEKEEYKLERERIRAKLEQDKLERRARGGYLGGAPIDLPSVETLHKSKQESENEQKKKASLTNLSPEEQVVANVERLKKYRVGGDGLTALKTLNVYVKNLVEKPDDEKFRTINLENAAFRKRVASLAGGVAFLKSLGFEKVEEEGLLKLSMEKHDVKLLQFARTQIDAAIRELS